MNLEDNNLMFGKLFSFLTWLMAMDKVYITELERKVSMAFYLCRVFFLGGIRSYCCILCLRLVDVENRNLLFYFEGERYLCAWQWRQTSLLVLCSIIHYSMVRDIYPRD